MDIPHDNIHFYLVDVENNKLTRRPSYEVEEIIEYGKLLTKEERLLNQLKPTIDEIKRAETTIEILSILQEVL